MKFTYMLDTNTISYIAKGRSPAARASLLNLNQHQAACISAVTEAEIRYGLARKPHAVALKRLMENMLASIRVLPWGHEEATLYGSLRSKLESEGKTLGNMDMMIAAHAIATDTILVTNDLAFHRLQDLRSPVNWATDL